MTLTRFADVTLDRRSAADPTAGLGEVLAGLDRGRTVEVLVSDARQAGMIRDWCNRQHHPFVDRWTADHTIHIYVRP